MCGCFSASATACFCYCVATVDTWFFYCVATVHNMVRLRALQKLVLCGSFELAVNILVEHGMGLRNSCTSKARMLLMGNLGLQGLTPIA